MVTTIIIARCDTNESKQDVTRRTNKLSKNIIINLKLLKYSLTNCQVQRT